MTGPVFHRQGGVRTFSVGSAASLTEIDMDNHRSLRETCRRIWFSPTHGGTIILASQPGFEWVSAGREDSPQRPVEEITETSQSAT